MSQEQRKELKYCELCGSPFVRNAVPSIVVDINGNHITVPKQRDCEPCQKNPPEEDETIRERTFHVGPMRSGRVPRF